MCGIFPVVLSVSILPSFIQPSHRAPIQACDFRVQTQLSFDSPRVIWDAEMPCECSEMGVGEMWGKGWCQESGCCSYNSKHALVKFQQPPAGQHVSSCYLAINSCAVL